MKTSLNSTSSPHHGNVLGIHSTESKIHKSRHKAEENEEIKAYLMKLQEIVPFMPKHKKLSKLEVITYVIDYIRDLRQTLGLPLTTNRVPMIPSLDSDEDDDEEIGMDEEDSSSDSVLPSPLTSSIDPYSTLNSSSNNNNNNNNHVSNFHLHSFNATRQPLSQISTPNNTLSSCGSQEIPQLVDKSSTGEMDPRTVSC